MENCARVRPLYLARVADYICNSGGTVGFITPHPVWDGGAFLFYGTNIPKSVYVTIIKYKTEREKHD